MRFALLLVIVTACGGTRPLPKHPASPPITPASDLADVRSTTPKADPGDRSLTVKDPRVVDLDIIKIRAESKGVGGEKEMTSVASADLFRMANEAVKAGNTKDAIARYRQLIAEFPESLYAPVSLFNIAAVYDHQGDFTSARSDAGWIGGDAGCFGSGRDPAQAVITTSIRANRIP